MYVSMQVWSKRGDRGTLSSHCPTMAQWLEDATRALSFASRTDKIFTLFPEQTGSQRRGLFFELDETKSDEVTNTAPASAKAPANLQTVFRCRRAAAVPACDPWALRGISKAVGGAVSQSARSASSERSELTEGAPTSSSWNPDLLVHSPKAPRWSEDKPRPAPSPVSAQQSRGGVVVSSLASSSRCDGDAFQQQALDALHNGWGAIPGALQALGADVFAQKGVNVTEVFNMLTRSSSTQEAAAAYMILLREVESVKFDATDDLKALKKAKDAIRVTAVLRCACERDPKNMDEFLAHLWWAFSVMLDTSAAWHQYDGLITGGSTMFQTHMPVHEAKAKCAALNGCNGFSYESDPQSSHVLVFFKAFGKRPKIQRIKGEQWTSYTWMVDDLWTQLKRSYHSDIDVTHQNLSNAELNARNSLRGKKRPKRVRKTAEAAAQMQQSMPSGEFSSANPSRADLVNHSRPGQHRWATFSVADIKVETLLNIATMDDDLRDSLRLAMPQMDRHFRILLQVLDAVPINDTRQLETVIKYLMPTKVCINSITYRLTPEFEQILRGGVAIRWGSPATARLPVDILKQTLFMEVED